MGTSLLHNNNLISQRKKDTPIDDYKKPVRSRGSDYLNHLNAVSRDIVLALLPLLFTGMYFWGARVLSLALFASLYSYGLDALLCRLRGRAPDYRDLSSVATALCIVLLMPASVTRLTVVIGCSAALCIAKHPFGGRASYIFMPAAVGVAFLSLGFQKEIYSYPAPFDYATVFGAAGAKLSSGAIGALKLGGVPTSDKLQMLLGQVPAAIGASAVLVIFASALYLLVRRAIDPVVLLSCLGTVALIAIAFPRTPATFLDAAFYELFSGNLLFGTVFMASDPIVLPGGRLARGLYAAMLGAITMLFRYTGAPPEGFAFALVFCSAISAPLQRFADSVGARGRWVKVKL